MNRSLRTLFAAAGLLALVITGFAAQRQCVIVDGFTQWNCGPCASWNPQERGLLEGMTRDTVISIKTHGWWPGANNDAFHLANVSESTARINYYSCNWVPWVMCDGSINISNVNLATLRNGIRTRYSTPSPCTIDNLLAVTASPTTVQVSGTITAEQALSSANLYVVLMRDLVTYASPPGSNGETQFPEVFCDATPNFNVGTPVTASPGNPYNFNVTLNRNEAWDVEGLTIVAFLQNNATKEVLQGTWAHVSQEYAFTTSQENPAQAIVATDGGEQGYLVQLENIGTMNDTYDVTLDGEWPAGWTYSIEENGGTPNSTSIEVPVNSLESTFLIVRVNPNGHAGSASFNVHVASQGNDLVQADHGWRLMSGLDVLVIDADGGDTYETYYAEALAAADENVNVIWGWWDTSLDEVDITLFDGVDVLVWFTGDLWQETLSPIDQLNVQDYLDAGGNLLITGQGIGFDMRNDQFFTDYLHADYVRNFPIGTSLTGVEGTQFGDQAFPIVSGTGANNQNRQASLLPLDNQSTLIFNYDQQYQGATQGGGLLIENDVYKIIYLGFGFEAIATEAARNSVMLRSIEWLLGVSATPGTPEVLPTEFSLAQNYPNPFNPETTIPFALPVRANVKLSVFDLLGREVATLVNGMMDAGSHAVNWNASDLSSGVYFYRLDAQAGEASFNSTRKVVLMK